MVNFTTPPPGFKPIDATEDQHKMYGYPPRPDKNAFPQARAVWDEIMSLPLQYIPTDLCEETDPATLYSPTWSGGIVPPDDPEQSSEKFHEIASNWIIPNPYPPPDATGDFYRCYCFVGFDGWGESAPPALMFGTKQIYDKGKHYATIFIRRDGVEQDFHCPEAPCVMPGDLVHACLSIEDDYVHVCLIDQNSQKRFAHKIPLPSSFKGATAEWIVGREILDYGYLGTATERLPNYGATFFHKAFAYSKKREYTLDNARIIDMVGTSTLEHTDDVISTAEHVYKNTLLVYAYKDEDEGKKEA